MTPSSCLVSDKLSLKTKQINLSSLIINSKFEVKQRIITSCELQLVAASSYSSRNTESLIESLSKSYKHEICTQLGKSHLACSSLGNCFMRNKPQVQHILQKAKYSFPISLKLPKLKLKHLYYFFFLSQRVWQSIERF